MRPEPRQVSIARAAAVLVLATVALMTPLASCTSGAAADTRLQGSTDYLPLNAGNRWELRSRSASEPMVLEVTGREGDAFVVRWINPFIKATFRFRNADGRVVMTGLDMGQGNASIPPGAVYWDFTLRQGERWKSPLGGGEITSRGGRVETPAGEFRDTIEVRTIDQDGKSMFWTFAPNVGLIRWGQGRDAFLLTSVRRGDATSNRAPAAASPTRPAAPSSGPNPLIGLDAAPHAKSGGGKRGRLAAMRQAYDAGITLLHSAPKWNEFERSPGRFDLSDDADAIGEFAEEFDLPIALNIRIVDTNQRSMPAAYERWAFDDERMAERLRAAIRSFPRSYKERTRYLAIGNEVNGYFESRRGEIAGYAVLLQRVLDTAREEFPKAQFTVNFTFSAVGEMERYRAITGLTDLASFTYYPLSSDFSMRSPSELRGDVDRMLATTGGKPLYIQEIGYASARRLNSSPERQAEFYEAAFQLLRERRGRVVGATFLFMSDFSQAVVDTLSRYYKLPNSDNFKAYIETLGLLERDGTPKPAWDVFRREATAIKVGR